MNSFFFENDAHEVYILVCWLKHHQVWTVNNAVLARLNRQVVCYYTVVSLEYQMRSCLANCTLWHLLAVLFILSFDVGCGDATEKGFIKDVTLTMYVGDEQKIYTLIFVLCRKEKLFGKLSEKSKFSKKCSKCPNLTRLQEYSRSKRDSKSVLGWF